MSDFCQHCRTRLDRHPRTKFCHILLSLDQSARSMYWWIAPKKNGTKYLKMGLSYRKLLVQPELQASQKFRVHVYEDRSQTQLRELEEVKDCRYKLKEEGNSKLK